MAAKDDIDDFRPKRGKGMLVVFLVLLVAAGAGVGIYFYTHSADRGRALETAATSLESLQRCLIGPPLAAGETIGWRVHRIELNRETERATISDVSRRWPMRCAAHATALRDALRAAGSIEPPLARLRDAAEATRNQLTHGQTDTAAERQGHPGHLENLMTAARGATSLPRPGAVTVLPPPAPLTILARDDLQPLYVGPRTGDLTLNASDRTQGSSLHVTYLHGAVYGCRFISSPNPAEHLARAQCASVAPEGPAVAAGEVMAFDVADGYQGLAPVRVGSGRETRIWGLPGATTPTIEANAFRGFVTADGTTYVVTTQGDNFDDAAASGRWRIARMRNGAATVRAPLVLPAESSRPDLTDDRVMYLASSEPGHGPARVGLFARRYVPSAGIVAAAQDAGDAPEGSRIAGRCRFGERTAVLLAADQTSAVAFGTAAGWDPIRRHNLAMSEITCTAQNVVAYSSSQRPTTLRTFSCTAAGCTPADARLQSDISSVVTRTNGSSDFAMFDGRVIIVWTNPTGGLRMRMAPLAEIDAARDIVLYDDHAHRGGFVQAPRIHVRGNVAVITFTDSDSETDGRRAVALRIDHDGTPSPVTRAP